MNLIATAIFFCCVTCIVASEKTKARIANHGEVAREGEFPYQVSIRLNGWHFCGGSLISNTHVLTAAHCVQADVDSGYFPGTVTVEVGSTRLGYGKSYNVKRISYHSGFQMRSTLFLPNDIAMVHLTHPVEFSNKVTTINLPQQYLSLAMGTTVIASGFGVDDARWGKISPVLKKLDARIVSNPECQRYHQAHIHEGKICAATGAGYGTCKGDSGGPLVDATKTTLIGVVSGGDGECKLGTPDVYTEVSRFIPYIYEEMNWTPGTANQHPATDMPEQDGAELEPWLDQQFQQQLIYPQLSPQDFDGLEVQESLSAPQLYPDDTVFLPEFYSNKKQ